jgi:hypothetical protein
MSHFFHNFLYLSHTQYSPEVEFNLHHKIAAIAYHPDAVGQLHDVRDHERIAWPLVLSSFEYQRQHPLAYDYIDGDENEKRVGRAREEEDLRAWISSLVPEVRQELINVFKHCLTTPLA